jgi:hypothetical protein
MKRNHVTCMANAAEIGSHVIVEENLAEQFCSFPGDHADGWQFSGGPSDLTVVRNKVRLNDTEGQTGCFSFFNDFADGTGFTGYRNVVFDGNYIAGGGYSVYLPSAAHPVESFKARGNLWSVEFHQSSGTYGPVYSTNPMDPATGESEWSDNRWLDAAQAGALMGIPGR